MSVHPWRFWAWPHELWRKGILGMNRRNAEYILAVNPRRNFPNVDDKVRTKEICQACGINVPKTYSIISRYGDTHRFHELVKDLNEFVIKPARGSGGRGIVVVACQLEHAFMTTSGQLLTRSDLRTHLATILSGLFSLSGLPDVAIIEERIVRHNAFDEYVSCGTPDVRIILYRAVPVMAMVRLPTKASQGRANLHQGAVAAALDLRTGCAFGGVCKNRTIAKHPDTGAFIQGFNVPQWDDLLRSAMLLADHLGMGYVGVDFVIDKEKGPVVLEANARPGLAIQVANRCGLLNRLQFVDQQSKETLPLDRRLAMLQVINAIDRVDIATSGAALF
jgi:alpha-L-glutamate ligase-like protein